MLPVARYQTIDLKAKLACFAEFRPGNDVSRNEAGDVVVPTSEKPAASPLHHGVLNNE